MNGVVSRGFVIFAWGMVCLAHPTLLRGQESAAPAAAPASNAPGTVLLRYGLNRGGTTAYHYRSECDATTVITKGDQEIRRDVWRLESDIDYRLEAEEQVQDQLFEVRAYLSRVRRLSAIEGEENELCYELTDDGDVRFVRSFDGEDESGANTAIGRQDQVRPLFEKPVAVLKVTPRGVVENAADPERAQGFSQYAFDKLLHKFKPGELVDFGWCEFPEKAVTVGEEWEETLGFLVVTEDIEPSPGFGLKCRYTLESVGEDGTAMIRYSAEVVETPVDEPKTSETPQDDESDATSIAKLREQSSAAFPSNEGFAAPVIGYQGRIRFDTRQGVLHEHTLTVTLKDLRERLGDFIATTASTVRYRFELRSRESVADVQKRHEEEWKPLYGDFADELQDPAAWPDYRETAAPSARVRQLFLPDSQTAVRQIQGARPDENSRLYVGFSEQQLRAKAAAVAQETRRKGADFMALAAQHGAAFEQQPRDRVYTVDAAANPTGKAEYAWVARRLKPGQVSHPIALDTGYVIIKREPDLEKRPDRVEVAHILVSFASEAARNVNASDPKLAEISRRYSAFSEAETLAEARRLAEEARRDGADFRALVLEHGADPGMRVQEFYEVRANGQMAPEFEHASLSLKEGEVSDPVRTSYGYHVIKRLR